MAANQKHSKYKVFTVSFCSNDTQSFSGFCRGIIFNLCMSGRSSTTTPRNTLPCWVENHSHCAPSTSYQIAAAAATVSQGKRQLLTLFSLERDQVFLLPRVGLEIEWFCSFPASNSTKVEKLDLTNGGPNIYVTKNMFIWSKMQVKVY